MKLNFADIKRRIPKILVLDKRAAISANKILKGYNHAKTVTPKYKPGKTDEIIPWMTYPFLDYIRNLDLSQKTIFEYGSGYSTVFWAKNAKSVSSVENVPEWAEKTRDLLPANATLLMRDDKEKFIAAINETDKKYDIIILDGYGFRYECALASIDQLSDNGMIVLDDTDNVYYKRICDFLKGKDLIQIDFVGLKPFSENILSTSIFIKRGFNFTAKYETVQPKIFVGDQRNYIA